MITKDGQLIVRPATHQDLQRLANLVHFEAYVHRHLDWRPPLDWIGSQPYLIIERDGEVVATLACPPDPVGMVWIRLFAVSSGFSPRQAWEELWPVACDMICKLGCPVPVAVIPLHAWFRSMLEASQFTRTHSVIVLSWKGAPLPMSPVDSRIGIREMALDDLESVEEVDHAAFDLVWQNSRDNLELAYRQAALATVAEMGNRILGYQISTATPIGGHLARLAVKPEYQGKGIGYAILRGLLSSFQKRGAKMVTVNTQNDNLSSIAIYQKAGFNRTGEEYPVYQHILR
jgi:ribosomal-protein-alanine N-acetyltransferase